jgi:glycosyltransferase involved in cell wall biosynthesis
MVWHICLAEIGRTTGRALARPEPDLDGAVTWFCRGFSITKQKSNISGEGLKSNCGKPQGIRQMKIIHVISSRTAGGPNISGIESHVLNLGAVQVARGHDLTVITDQPPDHFVDACHEYGITIASEPGLASSGKDRTITSERTTQNLSAQFLKIGADVVHCHHLVAYDTIQAARRVDVPCVYTHHTDSGMPIPRDEYRNLRNMKFSVIAVCGSVMNMLRDIGIPGERLYHIPNGTMVMPKPTSRPGASTAPDLIFVGFLVKRKGIDIALLMMSELRWRRGDRCPALNIYGSGNDVDVGFLKEMTTALRLDDIVSFRGHEPGILERCPSTDILILPSRFEAAPLVVLEGMSRGMPIVASDVGDVAAMLPDKRFGRVVRPNSILAFADAVEELISDIECGRFDPDVVITRHHSNFTNEIMADRVQLVYERALRTDSR